MVATLPAIRISSPRLKVVARVANKSKGSLSMVVTCWKVSYSVRYLEVGIFNEGKFAALSLEHLRICWIVSFDGFSVSSMYIAGSRRIWQSPPQCSQLSRGTYNERLEANPGFIDLSAFVGIGASLVPVKLSRIRRCRTNARESSQFWPCASCRGILVAWFIVRIGELLLLLLLRNSHLEFSFVSLGRKYCSRTLLFPNFVLRTKRTIIDGQTNIVVRIMFQI